ncbi:MAG: putative lipid II flippase FtsW [Thermoleophilia bacterium]
MSRPPLRSASDAPRQGAAPRRRASHGPKPEKLLVVMVLGLVCFGMVMVYSASSAPAVLNHADPAKLLIRQGIFAAIGFAAFWCTRRMDLRALNRLATPTVGVSIALLCAVMLTAPVNGARRWLPMPLIGQFQPAELAKVAVVLWVAAYASRNPRRLRTLEGMVPVLGVAGVMSVLILIEPDLGTASTLFVVALAMLLVAGSEIKHVVGVMAASGALAMVAIAAEPYRMARLTAFLHPHDDPGGKGYQIIQALLAFGSGGFTGRGLGNGLQKANYLPEAHTDMILATIGEELGILGVIAVVAAITVVALLAFRIALGTREPQRRLLAVGLATLVAVQGLDNIAATLGMIPITGVPLPFVSYGGSSLIVLLASVGILVNIAGGVKHERAAATVQRREHRDRGGRDGRPRDAGAGRGRSAAAARR